VSSGNIPGTTLQGNGKIMWETGSWTDPSCNAGKAPGNSCY